MRTAAVARIATSVTGHPQDAARVSHSTDARNPHELATTCGAWTFGDTFRSGGTGSPNAIGTPIRGGYRDSGFPNSGIFHYDAAIAADAAYEHAGFRCAR